MHEIPARSRLVPSTPITSPEFVYRRARDTDVRLTFARVRGELDRPLERGRISAAPARGADGSAGREPTSTSTASAAAAVATLRPVGAGLRSAVVKQISAMLQFTAAGSGPRLMLIVHHDDAEREYCVRPEVAHRPPRQGAR